MGPAPPTAARKVKRVRSYSMNGNMNGNADWVQMDRVTAHENVQWVHLKFMLVDPLSDKPIVVTGSANFSAASTTTNDENMLVIRDNKRVADIYFGEFMRVFDHLYSRYIVGKLKKAGTSDPDAGFLKEDAKDWVPQHFKKGRKELRRLYFMSE